MRRVIAVLGLAGLVSGCWMMRPIEPGAVPAGSPATQAKLERELQVRPLPGGMDDEAFFDSNSPEVVQAPGVMLSTLAGNPAVHQNHPIKGDFTIFSHHIAKDEPGDEHRLHIGLLVVNGGDRTVTVSLKPGVTYLSQPDALFVPLPTVTEDPGGSVYAGPGDRAATDVLHGRSNLPGAEAVLPPHSSYLAYNLPIPTNVAIPPPINGRTVIMRGHADGPIGFADLAVFAAKDALGAFVTPTSADFQAELARERLSGPRDKAPTPWNPASPAPPAGGGFRYGRVAGVAHGATWTGRLEAPTARGTVAYPIAAVYLNRMGTQQDQSAALVTRYADTAYAAHGNYGATYALTLPLPAGRYKLALTQPVAVAGGKAHYLDPPNKPVMFRGPIKLTWNGQTRYVHVVLRHGEEAPPFARIDVPAGKTYDLGLTLSYPADATPPQLLSVTRD
ncbi:MAG: hypothetical protein JWM80_1716 [Cyanobacteria bacterium RYN_339]|nr:hypothetical protein [Cyanobacteria bacterium RYN_339]